MWEWNLAGFESVGVKDVLLCGHDEPDRDLLIFGGFFILIGSK